MAELPSIPSSSLISITEVTVADESIAEFLNLAALIFQQIGISPGVLFRTFQKDGNIFRTLTVWSNQEDMKQFRNNGRHAQAMENEMQHLSHTRYLSFSGEVNVPDWDNVVQKLDSAYSQPQENESETNT